MSIRAFVGILVIVLYFFFAWLKKHKKGKKELKTKVLTGTAILTSMAIVLYLVPAFNLPLPIFPSFLKIHFDELPAFLAGYAYGPLSALVVICLKTVAKLPFSTSACVGEFSDMLYSTIYVLPAVLIYRKRRTIKGALLSFFVGSIIQIIFSSFFTTFVILNYYMRFMQISESSLIQICSAINKNVTSLGFTFMFYVAIPFNIVKDALVFALTFLLYKRTKKIIDKIGQ